jgi:hypothetical protein
VEGVQRHLSEQKMWPTMKDNVAIPSASIVGKYFLVVRPLSNMHKATTLHKINVMFVTKPLDPNSHWSVMKANTQKLNNLHVINVIPGLHFSQICTGMRRTVTNCKLLHTLLCHAIKLKLQLNIVKLSAQNMKIFSAIFMNDLKVP